MSSRGAPAARSFMYGTLSGKYRKSARKAPIVAIDKATNTLLAPGGLTRTLRQQTPGASWRAHSEQTLCRDTDRRSKVQDVDRRRHARLRERRIPPTIDNLLPSSGQPPLFGRRGPLLEPIPATGKHAHSVRL